MGVCDSPWDLRTKTYINVCIFASVCVCIHIAIFRMFVYGSLNVCVFICILTYPVLYVCRGVLCEYVLLCDCVGVCVSKTISWDFMCDSYVLVCVCACVLCW